MSAQDQTLTAGSQPSRLDDAGVWFWDFLKNFALAGGFLLLAFGPNATGVGSFLHHPLASSHPYEIIQGGVQ